MKKQDFDLSKTQLWLIEALLSLMERDDYHKITITQIVQEADLARATFYLNYKTKDDVLRSYMRQLTARYRQEMMQNDVKTPYLLAHAYFDYWAHNTALIRLLQRHGLFIMLLDEFYRFMDSLSQHKSPASTYGMPEMPEAHLNYFNAFHSAGLWFMLEQWIKKGEQESPHEMACLYAGMCGCRNHGSTG